MLQWNVAGNWEHRAYWGENLIGWGADGTASRYPMGALPAAGNWVRLEVPAAAVGLSGQVVQGMAFALYDGRAWFDRAGKNPCTVPTAAPPSSFPAESVWVEDGAPAGARLWGTWNWDTTQKASGTQSHTDPAATGKHEHSFDLASNKLYVAPEESLVCYVLIDPCNPPQEIMLQWQDASGSPSWEHRAFWGADLITTGINSGTTRSSRGPLPAAGDWVRLEVPASAVGLAGQTIQGMAFTLYGGRAWFDRGGKTVCTAPIASPPSSLPADAVWVEDGVPAGARLWGTWNWDTTQKASGTQSHTEPAAAGKHEHSFDLASDKLYVAAAESLVCYLLIDSCDPPQEIMLQWLDASGSPSWEHRAFWGADLITGITRSSRGALPDAGAWVRLEVPASAVGLAGQMIQGMTFTVYGGRAWFDRAGKTVCTAAIAAPPTSLPADTVWVDDQLPTGAVPTGIWTWDTAQKASGTQSNTEPAAAGLHQHYFTGATTTLNVGVGEKLVCYVLIDRCDPPKEIMLQWFDSASSWEHRAYWGADLIVAGTPGTASRHSMGALPQSGTWVRLEVPASALGLEGKTVTGMAFTLHGGHAWFDRAGKASAP